MELKICPLCGKNTKGDETYCDDCLQMAKDEFPDYIKDKNIDDDIISEDTPTSIDNGELVNLENDVESIVDDSENSINERVETQQQDSPPAKTGRATLIFTAIALILLVAIGAVGSYKVKQERLADEEVEIAFWNRCAEEGTHLAYSKYLVRYPEGKFTEEGESIILKLREEEKKEWLKLTKSSDINAFSKYLSTHPDSPYKGFIYIKIDSLAWILAKKENTFVSYNNYLDSVKLGSYVGNYAPFAQKEYDYLSQLKEVEGEDLKDIKKNMDELAKSLSASQYEKAQKLVNPLLAEYFGTKQKDVKEIIASMKEEKKRDKIKSITYTVQTDSLHVIQDNLGLYFFDIFAERKTTYIDKKKKEDVSSFSLKIELDKNKALQSILLKEK